MRHAITVRDVHDFNNKAGKKNIYVTSLEDDELIKSQFSMTMAFMFPDQKLFLSTVSPEDTVSVVLDSCLSNPLLLGEFNDILSENDFHSREPICQCFTPLVTDGFDVYCPNQYCGLTLHSRIENLATCSMFTKNSLSYIQNYISPTEDPYMVINDDPDIDKPFSLLLDRKFWNIGPKPLESFLLDKSKNLTIDMSTFLIDTEFSSFIDSHVTHYSMSNRSFMNVSRFFDDMNELVNRRDFSSARQNKLILQFMNCLGIESLSREILIQLFNYEQCMEQPDPLLPYFYSITHPKHMIDELGIHPLEAKAIYSEVVRRKYEFHDICLAYTSHDVASDCFGPMGV